MKHRLLAATVLVALAASTLAVGRVYGLKSTSIGGGGLNETQPPVHLFSFAADGADLFDHGVVTMMGDQIMIDALAYSPKYGLLGYAYVGGEGWFGSEMLSISTQTCVASPAGGFLPERDIRGAAFDSQDRLWGLCFASQKLVQMDPATSQVLDNIIMLLDGQPFTFSDAVDIAFDGDQAYITAGANIYALDVTTGVLALKYAGNMSQDYLVGLAVAPGIADRLLAFEVQGTDDILWFNTQGGMARNVLFSHILPSYNAGRGDLASMPQQGYPISGTIHLADHPTGMPFPLSQVRLYKDGSLLAEWGAISVGPDGTFTVFAPTQGDYAVTVKSSHWLGQTVSGIVVGEGGASGLVFNLINGDIDGDNAVTVFDYMILSDSFDTTTSDWSFDPRADLDSDGAVTVFDYAILSDSFDLVGDE